MLRGTGNELVTFSDPKGTSSLVSMTLPEHQVHVRGCLFEREPALEHHLPSGPQLEGSRSLRPAPAGVLWSYLPTRKAKIHRHAGKLVGVL